MTLSIGTTADDPAPVYIPDAQVDESLDAELRALFTRCFTKPEDAVFQTRRYWREPYPHRWIIRDASGVVCAHAGVHEKTVLTANGQIPVAGLCEVSVHPDCRGRGYVRRMMAHIHPWLAAHGFPFALLFGKPAVYTSSGYSSITNLFSTDNAEKIRKTVPAMVHPLSTLCWPTEEVDLPGLKF